MSRRSGGSGVLRRTATIGWGLPVVAACVWLGGWPLAAAAAALAVAALREWWPLGRPFGVDGGGPAVPVWIAAAALIGGAALGRTASFAALPVALGCALVGALWHTTDQGAEFARPALARAAWAITGLLYIPWLLGFALLLRAGRGPAGLAFVLAVVWVADIAAFLVGRAAGRRPLAPAVSPGKTVEGAAAALAAGVLAAALAARLPWIHLPEWRAAATGLVLAGLGLLGDLWESLCKRAAGVKDSGSALPGHGGVLDRFDSLLFALPAAYGLLVVWAPRAHG